MRRIGITYGIKIDLSWSDVRTRIIKDYNDFVSLGKNQVEEIWFFVHSLSNLWMNLLIYICLVEN